MEQHPTSSGSIRQPCSAITQYGYGAMRLRERKLREARETRGGGSYKEELEGFAWMRRGGGMNSESVGCRGCEKDVAAVAELKADRWSPV